MPARLLRWVSAWLVAICALWSLVWWQPYLPSGATSGQRVLASGVPFLVACTVTVAFGALLSRLGHTHRRARLAWLGSAVLGVWSVVELGIWGQVDGGGFLPTVLGVALFGSVIFLGALVVGFVILLLCIGVGSLLARASGCVVVDDAGPAHLADGATSGPTR